MEINISEQTIQTVYNSLRATAHGLKSRIRKTKTSRDLIILNTQLEEVEDALFTFAELLEVTL